MIDFKHVGRPPNYQPTSERVPNTRPIGIKTPLELDKATNSIFKMHTEVRSQIADNLRNLVLTNWGERLGIFDFGANLRPLVAEYTSKTAFEEEAAMRIQAAVGKWMPFIDLVAFDSRADYESNVFVGIIRIFITYSIPVLNIADDQLEVVLAVM